MLSNPSRIQSRARVRIQVLWFLPFFTGLSLLCSQQASASWALYAGKNMTADGSVLLAGYGDEPSSHWLRIEPRRQHPEGATVRVGATKDAWYPGERMDIPQATETFAYISMDYSAFAGFPPPLTNGGMNEHQVAARDVMALSRRELIDMTPNPQKGPQYSDLSRIVMERAHTAREAVEICGDLIDRYGYTTYGGNSHLFADANEGWVFKDFAGGQGLWVAERLGPDEVRVSHPGYIGDIPDDYMEHPDYMGSANLISFAVEQGWYDPNSGAPFNVYEVYDDHGEGNMRSPSVTDLEERLRKLAPNITIADMMALQRVKGYAWDSAGYGTVAHLREGIRPEAATLWVAPAPSLTAPFFPVFVGIREVPPEYQRHRYLTANEAQAQGIYPKIMGLESTRYAYRECKRLFYLVHEHYEKFMPEIEEALQAFEQQLLERQPDVEKTAEALFEAGEDELALDYMTYYVQTESLNAMELVQALAESIEARTKVLYGIRVDKDD